MRQTNAQVCFMVKSFSRSHLRFMTDFLKQAIATQVRVARERRKWTQEKLAAEIGKTPESVSNIERGVHLPTLDTLLDLANVLDLDVSQMIAASRFGRKLTKERAKQEAEIALIVRNLSDAAVGIAAEQIAVLDRVK
jgi:transcriptional regulator with XRE-family HTH domain